MESDRISSNEASVHDREDDRNAGTSIPPTGLAAKRHSAETSREKQSTDVEMIDGRPKDEFDRFTQSQKKRMTAIVSFSALLSRMSPYQAIAQANSIAMASSIFLPSVPQLADDLKTSETIINVTIAIFIVVIGVAPVIWSPLSGFYGRKPVYLASMPITIAGSIGVALSRNVGDIIGTRVLQGIGSSAVLAVGAGTIGDIFRPTERANAMGWFYSGVSR